MSVSKKTIRHFHRSIWQYYRRHRRNLPWRRTFNPYRILVSEVMLQQTQVSRVLQKYPIFIKQFPNFKALNQAPVRNVLMVWQGLGYNRRALMLKKLSGIVMEKYRGELPQHQEILEILPGIGKTTAGAIAAFAFLKPSHFIETNIRRVYIHFFFPRRNKVSDAEILELVRRTVSKKDPREWYYALMDYGAMLGKTIANPNRRSMHYIKQSPFQGSHRELRGKLLRFLLKKRMVSASDIKDILGVSRADADVLLHEFIAEGIIGKSGRDFRLSR